MKKMIYRITNIKDWEAAQKLGYFESADLQLEGFIHACSASQIEYVANTHYQDQGDLIILKIDEAKIDAPLVWENPNSKGERFPHIYGRIPATAVIGTVELKPNIEGWFFSPLTV